MYPEHIPVVGLYNVVAVGYKDRFAELPLEEGQSTPRSQRFVLIDIVYGIIRLNLREIALNEVAFIVQYQADVPASELSEAVYYELGYRGISYR